MAVHPYEFALILVVVVVVVVTPPPLLQHRPSTVGYTCCLAGIKSRETRRLLAIEAGQCFDLESLASRCHMGEVCVEGFHHACVAQVSHRR